jgi:hypothetical protein
LENSQRLPCCQARAEYCDAAGNGGVPHFPGHPADGQNSVWLARNYGQEKEIWALLMAAQAIFAVMERMA